MCMLHKIAYYLHNEYRNVLNNNKIKKNNIISSHLGKINIQLGMLFSNKIHLLQNTQNDTEMLANLI